MDLTAADLLAGPRGRGLCLAVAHRLDEEVWPAWLGAGRRPADVSLREKLVRAVMAVDVTALSFWCDPLLFLDPMDESVSHAMYWQPPHDDDVIAADPAVTAALEPLAAAIATSPAAGWWTTPVDLSALRYTSRFDDDHPPMAPVLLGAAGRLTQWHADTRVDDRTAAARSAADPGELASGSWWSTPALTSLITTTRPLPGLGSIQLVWEEDSFGEVGAEVWPLQPTQPPRVWEVDGPAAWVELVERYPFDVSAARRHDWHRAFGRRGPWLIPDWASVAADWDAVHVSVAGYLATATRALPVGTAATVLAGWNPDQTWWLTDILELSAARSEIWCRIDEPDPRWLRQDE